MLPYTIRFSFCPLSFGIAYLSYAVCTLSVLFYRITPILILYYCLRKHCDTLTSFALKFYWYETIRSEKPLLCASSYFKGSLFCISSPSYFEVLCLWMQDQPTVHVIWRKYSFQKLSVIWHSSVVFVISLICWNVDKVHYALYSHFIGSFCAWMSQCSFNSVICCDRTTLLIKTK